MLNMLMTIMGTGDKKPWTSKAQLAGSLMTIFGVAAKVSPQFDFLSKLSGEDVAIIAGVLMIIIRHFTSGKVSIKK